MLPVIQPSRVTVMIKPVGAMCNLRCRYCYYLPTMELFGGRERRMSLDTLEALFAGMLPRFDQHVTIAWQGGEPTMAGRDFFQKAIDFQNQYKRPGQTIAHALQTNATLLDDDWCRFLKSYGFLVGVSIDGPPQLHDHHRLTVANQPSCNAVLAGLKRLQRHEVEYNILCVLNERNVKHPDEVFAYLINLGARHLQFIPAIEWVGDGQLAPFSPTGEQYGEFMCRVFDLWYDRYRTSISIRLFDALLNQLVLGRMPLCINDASCHNQLTIEHDGSVFGCDHFVEDRWRLGRIEDDRLDTGWFDRVDQDRLGDFARRKADLPEACVQCDYNALCHGGCPKHRPGLGDRAEASTLCPGYRRLFEHAGPRLKELAGYLRRGMQPPPPAPAPRRMRRAPAVVGKTGRNEPCPCGSGLKFKRCCGR